ncbi:type III secretion exporter [Solidesulfovibrio fructosivorans JJ]]|uniref:Type III secretion exporter n=1 Tax=Solidesulfovibrio fructosivorans JJ] TaxID=596151 RepID=E1JYP2_SOLFR|nr:flagellar type III secretion system protein FlhB [Solidesulfovibrio fructosivorans]EFL50462.1 type III secretion exporter [Solidesulfovibrio fructosivorans JJ]]
MARDPSKTEQATQKRRDKAREKGSVARSQELPKLTVLFAGLFVIRLTIRSLGDDLKEVFTLFLGQRLHFEATVDAVNALFWMLSGKLAMMLLPLLVVIAIIAFITQRIQVGSIWHSKLFEPDFSNLFNPIAALQKLLINPKTLVQLGKQVAMASAIAVAPYLIIKNKFNEFLPLFYQSTQSLTTFLLENGFTMVLYTLFPMVLIAVLDVWYTRWDYEENLKMTKDEVKDETKQALGDPVVKQQQRRKMMEVMQRRMLQDVPKADVVITNPTHLACALRYDPKESPAPLLLAKGADHLAEKIKEIARENRIPIRENKPLAQALYKNVEIGQTIPEDLYQAVASILAQLDKFKRPGHNR